MASQIEYDLMRGKTDSSRDFGITRMSSLFNLRESCEFDPFEQTPDDLFHVLFEGIVPYTLRLFFHSLLENSVIHKTDIPRMEREVRFFKYHCLDKARAPTRINFLGLIEEALPLRMKGYEIWTFLRILPLYSFSSSFHHLPQFEPISLLLQLVSVLTSRQFQKSEIILCRCLATIFIQSLRAHFPGFRFLPKFHYLMHIIDRIEYLGPPAKYWCMRFEAKHKKFKNIVKFSNYRNILCQIQLLHYIQLSWLSISRSFFPLTLTSFARSPDSFKPEFCAASCTGKDFGTVTRISWKGTEYIQDSVFDLHDNRGTFALIRSIFICKMHERSLWLRVELLHSIRFDQILNCQICTCSGTVITVAEKALTSPECLPYYGKIDSSSAVIHVPLYRKF